MPRNRHSIPTVLSPLGAGLLLAAGCGIGPAWAADPASSADAAPLALRGSLAEPAVADPAALVAGDPQAANIYSPFFALDWSVAMQGGTVTNDSGTRMKLLFTPSIGATHLDSRTNLGLHATAALEELGNTFQISDLRGSLASTYRLDSHLDLGANADISVSREEPGSANLASNVSEAPLTIAGTGDLSVTRHFGRLDATLRGNLERDVYGDTTLSDGTTQSNTDQDRWVYGGGLRLTHPITPILSAFADASVNRENYDAPSRNFLVKLDGIDYALRGGLSGKWNSIAEAQASIGYGLRTFDSAGIPPVQAALYDASLILHPNSTLALNAGFSTAIQPPGTNGSGTAEVLYSANGGARYTVNDWLALRVSATWYHGTFANSPDFERGYSAGIGLDYALSRHTKLTADYDFAHDQASPNTPTDTQTVLMGVTLSR